MFNNKDIVCVTYWHNRKCNEKQNETNIKLKQPAYQMLADLNL